MSTKPTPPTRSNAPWLIGVGVLVVVMALVIALIVGRGKSSPKAAKVPTGSTAAKVVAKATSVPASVYEAVAAGTSQGLPKAITGPKLTAKGKPELFFMGAEYCPYCATERWAIVTALARFGTFSNLGLTHSSGTDVYPNTPTFTFYGSTYRSTYFTFTSVEIQSNKSDGNGGYQTLQTPTAAQQQLVTRYDQGGSIPFLDFGGQYAISGATYDPAVLQGKTPAEVANLLADPTSAVSKGAIGSANALTAAICQMTNGRPGSVCSTPSITSLRSQL